MLRCALLVSALAATAFPVAAQRTFPATALRGELVVVQPPDVRLNGKPARLAPGARIHNETNMVQLSGTLVGQKRVVNYTVDPLGHLHDVWILTASEASRKPWPTTQQEAQTWVFDPTQQRWAKP
jgi:hypothetical protein